MSSLSALNLLLAAAERSAIERAVTLVFLTRNQPFHSVSASGHLPTPLVRCREVLGLHNASDSEMTALREALLECISVPMASGQLEDLATLLQEEGADVNPKLKQLIGQVIASRLDVWRETATTLDRVSLPRLVDYEWDVRFQRASSAVADMQRPVVVLSLTTQALPTVTFAPPTENHARCELSRQTLDTMVDGLSRIREQLQTMT